MDLTLLVKALGAFFAIMNPFVNLPLFLSLTAGQEPAQQRRTAWRTTLFSALMCAVVAVNGSALTEILPDTTPQMSPITSLHTEDTFAAFFTSHTAVLAPLRALAICP